MSNENKLQGPFGTEFGFDCALLGIKVISDKEYNKHQSHIDALATRLTQTIKEWKVSTEREQNWFCKFMDASKQVHDKQAELDTAQKRITELEKERDCWIYNAKELQKQANNLEQQRADLTFKLAKGNEITSDSQAFNLTHLSKIVHQANRKWWFDEEGNPIHRNKAELLALIHSEISECLEGERKGLMDDKLPHRKMAEVELIDALIRILDYAWAHGYDVQKTFNEKMNYNSLRQDHKNEEKLIAEGKQF